MSIPSPAILAELPEQPRLSACSSPSSYPPSRWFVLSSPHLRALVLRALRAGRLPAFNYAVTWRDARGYGLHLARADWVRPGSLYVD